MSQQLINNLESGSSVRNKLNAMFAEVYQFINDNPGGIPDLSAILGEDNKTNGLNIILNDNAFLELASEVIPKTFDLVNSTPVSNTSIEPGNIVRVEEFFYLLNGNDSLLYKYDLNMEFVNSWNVFDSWNGSGYMCYEPTFNRLHFSGNDTTFMYFDLNTETVQTVTLSETNNSYSVFFNPRNNTINFLSSNFVTIVDSALTTIQKKLIFADLYGSMSIDNVTGESYIPHTAYIGSPEGVGFNLDGYSDLTDFQDRQYVSLYELAYVGLITTGLVGAEFLMKDFSTGFIYKMEFVSMDFGSPAMEYNRTRVLTPTTFGTTVNMVFVDGTEADSISASVTIRRPDENMFFNSIQEVAYSEQNIDTVEILDIDNNKTSSFSPDFASYNPSYIVAVNSELYAPNTGFGTSPNKIVSVDRTDGSGTDILTGTTGVSYTRNLQQFNDTKLMFVELHDGTDNSSVFKLRFYDLTTHTIDPFIYDLHIASDNSLNIVVPYDNIDRILLKDTSSFKQYKINLNTVYSASVKKTTFSKTTVYELPDNSGKLATEEYVETLLEGISPDITYGRVIFVDPTYTGGESTQFNFTKPFTTITAAVNYATTQSPSQTNRVLVYVRASSYYESITLRNYVDVHFETGCYLQSYSSIFGDSGTQVSDARVTGNAIIDAAYGPVIFFTKGSKVKIEFDKLVTTSTMVFASPTQFGLELDIVCNSMESTSSLGSAFGNSFRGSFYSIINITARKYIKSPHDVFEFRNNWFGECTINCPNIELTSANLYGGDFKSVLKVYSAQIDSKITINGNLQQTPGTSYIGGISAAVTIWGGGDCNVLVNGNVYGNNSLGVLFNGDTANTKLRINGDVYSNLQTMYLMSSGQVYVNGGTLTLDVFSSSTIPMIQSDNTTKLFLKDCTILNKVATYAASIVLADLTTVPLTMHLYNCLIDTQTASVFLTNDVTTVPGTVLCHNVIANKPIGSDISNVLTHASGFIEEANLVVPTF